MHTVREGGCFSFFLQMKMNGGTEEENKCAQYVSTHLGAVSNICLAQLRKVHWIRQVRFFIPLEGGDGGLYQPKDKQRTSPHNAYYSSSVIQRKRERVDSANMPRIQSLTAAAVLALVW